MGNEVESSFSKATYQQSTSCVFVVLANSSVASRHSFVIDEKYTAFFVTSRLS